MKLGSYTRVSTQGQGGNDRYSLPQQREEAESFSKTHGAITFKIYEDKQSGSDVTRSGWVNLIDDAEKGVIDTIWVGKADRFSRNTIDGLTAIDTMRKNNIRYFIGNVEYDIFNEETKLLITMQFAFAEYEKMMIKKRTSDGRIKSRNEGNGRINNTLGFINCWDEQGKPYIKIDETEAETVRYIFKMYVEERLSYTQMAHRLNDEGYKCKKYGQTFKYKNGSSKVVESLWVAFNFLPILKRPEYVCLTYNADNTVLLKSNYFTTPIVDKEIWDKAQDITSTRQSKLTVSGYRITNHELSGIVRCEECNSKYYYRSYDKLQKNRAKGYFYYAHKLRSIESKTCSLTMKLLQAPILEDIFSVIYLNTFTDRETLEQLYKQYISTIKKDEDELEADKKRIASLILDIDKKLNNFVIAIENGIDLDKVTSRMKELQADKINYQENLKKKEQDYLLKTQSYEMIYKQFTFDSLKEFLESKGEARRLIYYKVLDEVWITKDSKLKIIFKQGRTISFQIDKVPVWLLAQLDNYKAGLYTIDWINEKREGLDKFWKEFKLV